MNRRDVDDAWNGVCRALAAADAAAFGLLLVKPRNREEEEEEEGAKPMELPTKRNRASRQIIDHVVDLIFV